MPDKEDADDKSPEVKKDLGFWVDMLSEQKMPALASTVNKMSKLTTDEDSRVSQLSDEVLKDPNLTSRVLQVANSVMYRGVAGNCATITRAIVLMGFTTIRDISLVHENSGRDAEKLPIGSPEKRSGQIVSCCHASQGHSV